MNLNLYNKTVIVTGGGSGMGRGICSVLASEGANVIVNYIIDENEVLDFVDQLNQQYDARCLALYGDITKAADLDGMIQRAIEIYGQIDVLVNNAGIRPTSKFVDMTDEEWELVININLTAAFKFSKRIVHHFLERKIRGHIINIISKAAYSITSPGHGHYAASKGGMLMLTKALANEVAKDGIIVNGIAPGIINTPMMAAKLDDPAVYDEYMQRIRLRRLAEAEEIGYLVAFLASDKSENICGSCVDVSGGMLI